MTAHTLLTRRAFVPLLLALVLASGIRFSEGGALLQIARGASASDLESFAQYVFDSPLKFYVLSVLPAHIVAIALVFFVLAFLPALIPFIGKTATAGVIAVLLFTPTLKVSIQNIGAGDGLTIALSLAALLSRDWKSRAVFLFFLGTWHPQQSFFIFGSMLAAERLMAGSLRRETILGAIGLFCAFLVYVAYRSYNDIEFDRLGYMQQQMSVFVWQHLQWLPLFFLPALAWLALFGPPPARHRRDHVLLLLWLAIVFGVAFLTTDLTRVFYVCSLPVFFHWARLNHAQILTDRPRALAIFAIVTLSPPLSWSGLDFFLYRDLASDFCKYDIFCF